MGAGPSSSEVSPQVSAVTPPDAASVSEAGAGPPAAAGAASWWALRAPATLLILLVLALSVWRAPVQAAIAGHGALATWLVVFVAMCLQALPFLVLGVVLSALVTVWLPDGILERVVPRRPTLAVPAAGACGVLLPGCECASVPVSRSLMARGVPASAALTFQLAAPAVNPVVLVSTAVAFGGRADLVLARFVASMLTAVIVGYLWLAVGRSDLVPTHRRPHVHGGGAIADAIAHDVLQAGGYLVVGAALAACVSVFVPREILDAAAGNLLVSVLALAVFAVVIAMCSEADAFIAAGLTMFPLTARLVFLVVGPAVDVKLVAMQVATYGRSFAWRFAPLTFVVAVVTATVVGSVLL